MTTEVEAKPKQKRFRWPRGEARPIHFNADKKLIKDFLILCEMDGMTLAEGLRELMRSMVRERKQSTGGLR